jgi:hypothetical protein
MPAASDRYCLRFGPYQTPRFRYGQRVFCERTSNYGR